MSMGAAFEQDRRANNGYTQVGKLVQGVAFAALVIAAGFAYFSVWIVIPTLTLTVAVVVWWIRSASARPRDARCDFEQRNAAAVTARASPNVASPRPEAPA
jgi:uncharacterized membrane protein